MCVIIRSCKQQTSLTRAVIANTVHATPTAAGILYVAIEMKVEVTKKRENRKALFCNEISKTTSDVMMIFVSLKKSLLCSLFYSAVATKVSSSNKSVCKRLSIKGKSGLDNVNDDWYTYKPTCSIKKDSWRIDAMLCMVNMGRFRDPNDGCMLDSERLKSKASAVVILAIFSFSDSMMGIGPSVLVLMTVSTVSRIKIHW